MRALRGCIAITLVVVASAVILTACNSTGPGEEVGEENPVVVARPDGSSRDLPVVGFNNNVLNSPLEVDRYRDTVATLYPEVIRYPGGTVGDFFDWRSGWVDLSVLPPDHPWTQLERRPVTPETLRSYLGDLDAQPLFALNAFSSSLSEQLALLRRWRALGGTVRHVELGNEYYFGFERFESVYPTAESYGQAMNRWIDSLRVQVPGAELCVIGASPSPNASNRRLTWNERLFPVVTDADAACFHPYFSVPADVVEQSDPLPLLMAAPYRRWLTFQEDELAALPPGWDAWLTEYNLFAPDERGVRSTWAHGLMTAFYTLLLMQEERVTVLLAHQVAGNPSFAAVEVQQPFGASQPYEKTAYGAAMGLIFDVVGGAETGRPLSVTPRPERTVDVGGGSLTYPQLVGWQVETGEALLLNAGATALDVRLPEMTGPKQVDHLYAENPLQPGVPPTKRRRETQEAEETISLPPFSLSRVRER
jgi:predicted small secreted protein